MSVIQISNLSFSYPGAPPALKISSWKLEPGEKVFLAGPSGSGKTTFLELIAGILSPTSGDLNVLGHDFSKLSLGEKDRVRKDSMSFIFQSFNLIPYLNVEENILLPFWLGYKDERTADQLRSETLQLMQKLDLAEHRESPVTALSFGQSQRVAAARAFLKRPKLLLADEPTSALDYDRRDAFLDGLFSLAADRGTALLFVSHDKTLQSHFDRVVQIGEWK